MAPPKRRQCATMVVDAQLAEAFPSYRRNQDNIEQGIRRSIGTGQALRALRKLLTIDVVVHVVYKLPAENISDTQVKSQIAVLNKDFRATNPDKSKVPPVWKGSSAIRTSSSNWRRRILGEDDDGDHAHRDDTRLVRLR